MEMSEEEKKKFLKEKKEKLQAIIDNDDPEMDIPRIRELEMIGVEFHDGVDIVRQALTDREVAFLRETSPRDINQEPPMGSNPNCRRINDVVPEEKLTDEDRALIQKRTEEIAQIKENMKDLPEQNHKGSISYDYYNIGTVKVSCRETQMQLLGSNAIEFEPNIIDKKISEFEEAKAQKEAQKQAEEKVKQDNLDKDLKAYDISKSLQEKIDEVLKNEDPSLDIPAYYNTTITEFGDPRMTGPEQDVQEIFTPRQVMLAQAVGTRVLNCNGKTDEYYYSNIGDVVEQESLTQEQKEALAKKAEEIKSLKESKDYNKKGRITSQRYIDYDINNPREVSVKARKGDMELLNMDKSTYSFKPNTISLDSIKRAIKEREMERSAR